MSQLGKRIVNKKQSCPNSAARKQTGKQPNFADFFIQQCRSSVSPSRSRPSPARTKEMPYKTATFSQSQVLDHMSMASLQSPQVNQLRVLVNQKDLIIKNLQVQLQRQQNKIQLLEKQNQDHRRKKLQTSKLTLKVKKEIGSESKSEPQRMRSVLKSFVDICKNQPMSVRLQLAIKELVISLLSHQNDQNLPMKTKQKSQHSFSRHEYEASQSRLTLSEINMQQQNSLDSGPRSRSKSRRRIFQ